MTAVLVALVGFEANFTGLGLYEWQPGDRVVFSASNSVFKPEDATVHRIRTAGKYTQVRFSEAVRQAWSAGTAASRETCGQCGARSSFKPSPYVTECASCYWPEACTPIAYPVANTDVRGVQWTYHVGQDGDAYGLFEGLETDRRFVHACIDCADWNRSLGTITLKMAVATCSPGFDFETPPPIAGFAPLYHPHHHTHLKPTNNAAELAIVMSLMLATAVLIAGIYCSFAASL